MNLASRRVFALILVPLAGFFALAARAVPVSVDMIDLRCVQTFNTTKTGDDDAYLLITGVAGGKEFSDRLPKDKAWTVAPKEPSTLWKGALGAGEFALVSITLMQGKGADAAKIKEYLDKKAEAEKKVAERAKPKLTQGEFDNLHDESLKADRKFIEQVKKIFS